MADITSVLSADSILIYTIIVSVALLPVALYNLIAFYKRYGAVATVLVTAPFMLFLTAVLYALAFNSHMTAVFLANRMVLPVLVVIAILPMVLFYLVVFSMMSGTAVAIFLITPLLLMVAALLVITFNPSLFWLVALAVFVFLGTAMVFTLAGLALSADCER
jgi:hypothetical protein